MPERKALGIDVEILIFQKFDLHNFLLYLHTLWEAQCQANQ